MTGNMWLMIGILMHAVSGAIAQPPAPLELARDGQSNYRIVVGQQASVSEAYAARELQRFLKEISGSQLAIVDDSTAATDREIVLGQNGRLEALGIDIGFESLGDEGFVIRTVGPRLVIAGGRRRGTLYGAYTFLEEYLGCRWWTTDESHIPRRNPLFIGSIDDRQVPAFEFRDTDFGAAHDGDWAARNKLHGGWPMLRARHGGKWGWYGSGHNFYKIIPPAEFFVTNPEFFSQINGQRTHEMAQLCLTNSQLPKVFADRLKATMRAVKQLPFVEYKFVSVSGNDYNGWCECEPCSTLHQAEGSISASLVQFVNQVAEHIEDEFPHCTIETYAYGQTIKPPRTIRPRDNVLILLCPFQQTYSHPMTEYEFARVEESFPDIIKDWRKLTDRIYIWYYPSSNGGLTPYPNGLRVMIENFRDFASYGVRGVFCNHVAKGRQDVAELWCHLFPKVAWNPNRDFGPIMAEALAAFYGPAARPVGTYLNLRYRHGLEEGLHVTVFAQPTDSYFTGDLRRRALALLSEADRLADTPTRRRRVRKLQLAMLNVDLLKAARLRRHNGRLVASELADRTVQLEEARTIAQELGLGAFESTYQLCRTVGRGFDVVTLSNRDIQVELVPQLSGHVFQIRDRRNQRTVLREPDVRDTDYPQTGGIQDQIIVDGEPIVLPSTFQAQVVENDNDRRAVLGASLNGDFELQHTVMIASDSGATVRIHTALTNSGSETHQVAFRTRIKFRFGRIVDCELLVPTGPVRAGLYQFVADKHDHEINLQDEPVTGGGWPHWMRLVAPRPVQPWLMVIHPWRKTGVRINYDPDQTRRCHVRWNFGFKKLDLDLFSNPITLAPGRTVVYRRSLDVMDDPQHVVAGLDVQPLQAEYLPPPPPGS